MGKIKVTIERGKDMFGAWAENVEGIYGAGDTVQETQKNIHEAIDLYKKYNTEIPDILQGNIEIEWRFDVRSLLEYYSGILTNAGLERITGINQKQLWNYANGVSKPRPTQVKKIETALHNLGRELIALSL
ncbi:type II toxin-antitoxin system HicB family antitoxin [uncultured Butyricimonas sp.]|uniref:type II toxin-antitoxin system HicB family antitoxin n=1 Tax=uncultured Butyricimonas sp. TaxID=1268785 RepID=UPI0026DDBC30|nr:antitoxin HicB [uncultured Butyricimonas sp.]